MVDPKITCSPVAFRAWIDTLDPQVRLASLLKLRACLQGMAQADSEAVRHAITTVVLPVLQEAMPSIRLSFEILLAGLEEDGETRFAAAVAAAQEAGLGGLVAVGCAEWAHWLALRAAWERADALFAQAQDRFRSLGHSDKRSELYPLRARLLAHLVDADALDRAIGTWLSEPLPPSVALRLLLERARSAIDADRCAIADSHIRSAEAFAGAADDAIGVCLARVVRGGWYWRFGAYARARDVFAAAESGLRGLGAAREADLVAANLFGLRMMIEQTASGLVERTRFERLRQRLRHEDLTAWWQLSLDLAVAAERDGDLLPAVRLYAEFQTAPAPRAFELKLAGLNFARLRVENGFMEGVADDLADARRDRSILEHPYLRMLAFETSAMHAERVGCSVRAAALYGDAVEALERWRQGTASEFLRVSLRGSRQLLFQRKEAVSIALSDPAGAWRTADLARAATFNDVLGGELAPFELGSLRGILRGRAALGRALRAPNRDKEAIAQLEVLLDRIVAEAPRMHIASTQTGLGAALAVPAATAFLSYSLTPRGLGGYVVRGDRITHCALLDATASDDLLRAVARWWRRHVEHVGAEEDDWQRETAGWTARLIEPLVDALDGIDRLGVVPYGPLTLLPWPGLWVASRQRYLDELFPSGMFVLPSVATGRLLAVPEAEPAAGAVACVCAGEGLTYGPVEAALVESALGPNLCRLDRAAIRPWQLRCLMPRARWLHLIGHGEFRPDLPMASAFLLGGGERWTGWDLATCRMPGSSVVLSACALGGTQDLPGGEWFGLLRGFFLAGARSVVAPLWPVRDLLSLVLMHAFYETLAPAGASLATSLRTARQTARAWGQAALGVPHGVPTEAAAVLGRAFAHWRRATVVGRHANPGQQAVHRAAMSDELCRLAHPRHWSVFQLYGDPAGTAPAMPNWAPRSVPGNVRP